MLEDLSSPACRPEVLPWAAPVPFFGAIRESTVATVGINPSNREFVDAQGNVLSPEEQRLPTLDSLAIPYWSDATGSHIREMIMACERYFERNPYRLWFDVLERMLKVGGYSYYSGDRACHLDLVAFATRMKWGSLEREAQRSLISRGRRTLAELIRDSPIQVLVLNGRSVLRVFEELADTKLVSSEVSDWTLPRSSGKGVIGLSYKGCISAIAGIELDRVVTVFGYNHNLQSSFGVTTEVMRAIGEQVGGVVASTNKAGGSG
jgi:hypothetical protein